MFRNRMLIFISRVFPEAIIFFLQIIYKNIYFCKPDSYKNHYFSENKIYEYEIIHEAYPGRCTGSAE